MTRQQKRAADRATTKAGRKKPARVPTEAVSGSPVEFHGKDLDDRRIEGVKLHAAVTAGTILRTSPSENLTVYASLKANSVAMVTRAVRNRRGTTRVEYACSCEDAKKAARRDCKHRFCEKLERKEAVVIGKIPRRVKITAGRRPARKRYSADGRSRQTFQRHARVLMPIEIPRLVLSLKTAFDARRPNPLPRHGKLTTDSLRAAALLLKICDGVSADTMIARYRELIEQGRLPMRRPPHQNSLSEWINDASLTPVLHEMLAISAEPFRLREIGAIIDSSKVSQLRTAHSRLVDYGTDLRPNAEWMKAHTLIGVETMVVFAVEFTSATVHDVNLLEQLVLKLPPAIALRFLLGDKAYLSEKVLGFLWERGIRAVIPVKSHWDENTKAYYYEASKHLAEWYDHRPRDFDEHYRLRPKIEGLFSLMKRLADGFCWSRGRQRKDDEPSVAWQNEVLCKFIYLNLRATVTLSEETGYREIEHRNHERFFPAPSEPLLKLIV